MMELAKRPNFRQYERQLYQMWEKAGYFTPSPPSTQGGSVKEPYTILLPPPNANADLHAGHAMYVIEDILVRFKRMQGKAALWVPGTDHAGFETQFVFEKKLAQEGKSRFDFDRDTFYQKIYDFVLQNSGKIQQQLRQLGFSLDWTRETFTLNKNAVQTVINTFEKMQADGLIYRDNYLVNYCPFYGTTFSDLEVKYLEKKDPLYYLRYGPFELATVRPETKFGDTAVAVHPKDNRYQDWIGQEIEVEGLVGKFRLRVIADEDVDPTFGTGVVKVTPAHDPTDFAMSQRHNLPVKQVIDFSGHLTSVAGPYAGLNVKEARTQVVKDLKAKGLITKIDNNYVHRVAVSYKGEKEIEPMVMPNWFLDVKKLATPAIQAARTKKVRFFPARFEKQFYLWMENIRPWVISRQIVFGIRIPAWYSVDENPDLMVSFIDNRGETHAGTIKELLRAHPLRQIAKGLQSLHAPIKAKYKIASQRPTQRYLQETDVFDTWFSSGQWPLLALGYPDSEDFKYFYPTNVLDTMWDILFFWVARMIMFGLYLTNKVPFQDVYLHSMVTDEKGAKMSKSKGNVVNPLELVEKYGADALRMSLVFGSAPGKPTTLSEEKVLGMRNFVTKIWNIARFILGQNEKHSTSSRQLKIQNSKLEQADRDILSNLSQVTQQTTRHLENYQFSRAAEQLYDFIWNQFASEYLESTKKRNNDATILPVLLHVLRECLKLLHPFMPFVTEEIYQKLPNKDAPSIMIAPWPSPLSDKNHPPSRRKG